MPSPAVRSLATLLSVPNCGVVANSANWYVDCTTVFFSYSAVKSLLPRSHVTNVLLKRSEERNSPWA